MLKVSEAVLEILTGSDVAMEALKDGILNLSAYAEKIHTEVEEKTLKPVKIGTIVVALSRTAENLDQIGSINPKIQLEELSIKAPLCDITFENTKENLRLVKSLSGQIPDSATHFFTVTQGIEEITIVASESYKTSILNHFKTEPKSVLSNLVGVSVRFGEEYIPLPNVIFAILYSLAVKRINLIEIVSTYTEITLVVEKDNVEVAIGQLNKLLRKT